MSEWFPHDVALLSIVVPVYNEEAAIGTVVQAMLSWDWPFPIEVIIVNDASSDQTRRRLDEITDARLRVVDLAMRSGSGAARRVGIARATGDAIAWIDGDGTYDHRELPALVSGLSESDQVIGVRSLDYGPLRHVRWAVKQTINRLVTSLWGTVIPDVNSGLRVFRRDLAVSLVDDLPDRFSCATTATLAALNRGSRVIFRPIGYRPRTTGSHSKFNPVTDTLRLLAVVCRLHRARPSRRV